MRSGTGLGRRGCTAFLVLLSLLVVGASAQQSTDNKPGEQQTSAPATLPAAQPASQAAVSPSEAASNAVKADDHSKDSPEKSLITTLGRGDLIEVNVYNVPELNCKVRVSNSGDVYLPLIDYVHVEGLTQEEAQSLIEKRLGMAGSCAIHM